MGRLPPINSSSRLTPGLMIAGMVVFGLSFLAILPMQIRILSFLEDAKSGLVLAGLALYGVGYLRWIAEAAHLQSSGGSLGPAPGSTRAGAIARVAHFGSYGFGAAAFAILKVRILNYDPGRVFPDTLEYVEVARRGLSELGFWAAKRPFTLPLLYKAIGVSAGDIQAPLPIAKVSAAQAALSIIGWLLLAASVALIARVPPTRLLTFVVVLGFGLTLHISQWDRLLLSESIATSLFALALSLIHFASAKQVRLRSGSWRRRFAYLLALMVLISLFSFTRDSNLPLLLGGAVGMGAVFLVLGRFRWEPWRRWGLGLSLSIVLLVLLQSWTVALGERWRIPFYHVMVERILDDDEATRFFLADGMPGGLLLTSLKGWDRSQFAQQLVSSERYHSIARWIDTEGRAVYVRYLISHPSILFLDPLRHHEQLLNPLSTEYRNVAALTPIWLSWLSDLLFPRSSLALGALTALTGIGMVHLWRMKRAKSIWLVPLFLVVMSPLLMLVVWHSDAIEVERHGFQAAMQLRLGLLILGLWIIDGELTVIRNRKLRNPLGVLVRADHARVVANRSRN